MTPLNRYIALMLVLLVTANTTFASQLVSLMHSGESQVMKQERILPPCHDQDDIAEVNSRDENDQHSSNCCDNDCTTCVSGTATVVSLFLVSSEATAGNNYRSTDQSLAEKQASSLYRPPILT